MSNQDPAQQAAAPTSQSTSEASTGDAAKPIADQTGTDKTHAPASASSPRPKPGPRPGPRPRAAVPPQRSAPAAALDSPAATTAPARIASDPSKFGRVDDDGTAWLHTPDGEREIGSWQAGTPAEGLAHFGRRFDDLATEVELLAERIGTRAGDPKKAQAAAQYLLDGLPTATVIGDVAALQQRLTSLIRDAERDAESLRSERTEARANAVARKEELATEAEGIGAESTQWKAAGDRLRAILDEWKTIKGIDRKTDDALWKRYAKARDAFNRRRGAHFAELDRERAGAKARKEELIVAAEELSSSTDWGPTAGKFRELLSEWKAAGRAPRDADDALWQRFKAAQDVFFGARNAVASERDAEFAANATEKLTLLAAAEADIDAAKNTEAARNRFHAFRDKWDEIGKVPREQMNSLENRARALEKRVRELEDRQWQRTDPEAQARAAQFADRAAQLEEQAVKAEERGKTKDAEKLRAQATQWREWADAAHSAIADR